MRIIGSLYRKLFTVAGLFVMLFNFMTSHASNPILVTGIVIDSESKEPLPFANVIYAHLGTSTNYDGEFVLLIEEPKNEIELQIKFIGYESIHMTLGSNMQDLIIRLQRSTHFLEDVTVYSAEQIMLDVNSYKQINYDYKDQLLSTYYKESVNTTSSCVYIAEGIFDIYLPTIYSNQETKIESVKTRKKEFISLDSLGIPMFNGHASDMIQSAVRREDSFLHKEEMGNYYYSKEDRTEYDGRNVLVIKFEPRNKKGTAKGTIYVDSETKAVIKTEYYPTVGNQYFWTNVKWSEEFTQIDGTWHAHRVSYSGTWDHFGETLTYSALLVITDFESVTEAPYIVNALRHDAIFFHEADGFVDDFWDDYNYVKLTLKEKDAVSYGHE